MKIPSLSPTNSSTLLKNFKNTVSISNDHISRNKLTLGKKNTTEIDLLSPRTSTNNYNNTISSEKSNFIANNVKTKNSDITNPFFYNNVAKEIIKLNQETMEYNRKESENKYNKKKNNRYYNDYISLSPEKIKNPNYYNLGESSLEINPIINKGHYSISFSRNHKNFNKQKSEFY